MRKRMTLLAGLFLAAGVAAAAEPATYHGTKTLTPKPGGTLHVEGAFHDITVVLAPGTSVEVTVDMKISSWPGDSKEALKAYEPTYSEEGNTILIRSRSKASFSMGTFNSSGSIAIRMPPGMNLDLHTGSGDIRSDYPGTSSQKGRHWSFSGGAGSCRLSVETGSGDILVVKGK